jgi:hypothetical protein
VQSCTSAAEGSRLRSLTRSWAPSGTRSHGAGICGALPSSASATLSDSGQCPLRDTSHPRAVRDAGSECRSRVFRRQCDWRWFQWEGRQSWKFDCALRSSVRKANPPRAKQPRTQRENTHRNKAPAPAEWIRLRTATLGGQPITPDNSPQSRPTRQLVYRRTELLREHAFTKSPWSPHNRKFAC